MAHIASRVEGRVDQVFADFPGTIVKKGEHLVSIYSPQLVTTQEEYLIAVRAEQERQKLGGRDLGLSLSSSALRRLELWGLRKQQLDELAQRGTAETHLIVYAPLGGTVIEKNIRPGQYVKEGDSLYTIADLGQVWLVLEIYEFDLSWVRQGQPVQVTLESEPAQAVTGQVAFIEPLLNQATRTVRVRVFWKTSREGSSPACTRRPAFTFRSCRTADRPPAFWRASTCVRCTRTTFPTSRATASCAECRGSCSRPGSKRRLRSPSQSRPAWRPPLALAPAWFHTLRQLRRKPWPFRRKRCSRPVNANSSTSKESPASTTWSSPARPSCR